MKVWRAVAFSPGGDGGRKAPELPRNTTFAGRRHKSTFCETPPPHSGHADARLAKRRGVRHLVARAMEKLALDFSVSRAF